MSVIISQTYKLRSFWFCTFTDICMVLTFPNANLCQLGIHRYQFWTSFMHNRNWQVESKLSLWYWIKHHYLIYSIKIRRSKMKCLPTPLVTLSFTKTNVLLHDCDDIFHMYLNLDFHLNSKCLLYMCPAMDLVVLYLCLSLLSTVGVIKIGCSEYPEFPRSPLIFWFLKRSCNWISRILKLPWTEPGHLQT